VIPGLYQASRPLASCSQVPCQAAIYHRPREAGLRCINPLGSSSPSSCWGRCLGHNREGFVALHRRDSSANLCLVEYVNPILGDRLVRVLDKLVEILSKDDKGGLGDRIGCVCQRRDVGHA
jgi:hypothetical protein